MEINLNAAFGGPLRQDTTGCVALASQLSHAQQEMAQLQEDFIIALTTGLTGPVIAHM